MKTLPEGSLMVEGAIAGLSGFDRLVIGVLKEHVDKHRLDLKVLEGKIAGCGVSPEFLVLDGSHGSQSADCCQIIQQADIDGAVFVKDCDNRFEHCIVAGNSVCISKLDAGTNAVSKSYVSLNKMGKLNGIVEKMVIGDRFCCGGYGFDNAKKFSDAYAKVKKMRGIDANEVYISHVIQAMLLDGVEFGVVEVADYIDWGDEEIWRKFCSRYKTLFVDLDGVLVANGSEYFEPKWGKSDGLPSNIATINRLYDSGTVQIILTTSRKQAYAGITEKQMKELGVKYHSVIYDLYHSVRVLVNDFTEGNPYPSAVSISIERNSDALDKLLGV